MQTITKSTFIILLILLISSCRKDDVFQPTPVPPPVAQKGSIFFQTETDVAGQPYHSSNLQAVVTIAKPNGDVVVNEQIVSLNLQSSIKTAPLELPFGNYRLTAFRLVYGSVHTHFAAPITGSAKASAVTKPLSIDFTIDGSDLKQVLVNVLKIQEGDQPQQYGYPAGSFDNRQEENNPHFKMKVRAVIKIGDIVYDSVPSSLMLTTFDPAGQQTTTYISMAAGVNEIQLSKSGASFKLRLTKWGITDEITLQKNDIDPQTIYLLGGGKQAKKLVSERTYLIENGREIPENKTDYFYNTDGGLKKIDFWMRKTDNTPVLFMVDEFEHQGNRVSKITRTHVESNSVLKETRFYYDQQGRVTGIVELANGMQTNAMVSYHPATQEVSIHYTFPGRTYDMHYYMKFLDGNVINATSAKSNHDNNIGKYEYDFQINPFRHMNWPDLFLTHSSKNNLIGQRKEYSGSYPTTDPYKFTYKYDADGYPTEVIKDFKSYPSGNHSFSSKTVYVY